MNQEKFSYQNQSGSKRTWFLWYATRKIIKNKKSRAKAEDRERNYYIIMSTVFQDKVYSALLLIPHWKVTTYGLLAHFVGCKSSQAIGQALTKNQNAPEIPCHRVIKTNRNIGGYAFGIEKKREILAREWIFFDSNDNLLDIGKIWDFTETE